MEEYLWSHWNVWPIFIQGWAITQLQATCFLACHLSPCMSLTSNILNTDKTREPTDYTIQLHSAPASLLKAMGTVYQAHSQGYEKLLPLVAQTSGWGSQTASIYSIDTTTTSPYSKILLKHEDLGCGRVVLKLYVVIIWGSALINCIITGFYSILNQNHFQIPLFLQVAVNYKHIKMPCDGCVGKNPLRPIYWATFIPLKN